MDVYDFIKNIKSVFFALNIPRYIFLPPHRTVDQKHRELIITCNKNVNKEMMSARKSDAKCEAESL